MSSECTAVLIAAGFGLLLVLVRRLTFPSRGTIPFRGHQRAERRERDWYPEA
jgi:hypothetical protein